MSKKSARIASYLEGFLGQELDAHYLAYFDCFNQQQFYLAHEVLEELWLTQRALPDGLFYKGLIQFAGAFVHLQKNRPRPAAALFKLAQNQLQHYSPAHLRLDVQALLTQSAVWIERLECTNCHSAPLEMWAAPQLHLLAGDLDPSKSDSTAEP